MQDYKPYQSPTQEGETFTMTLKSTNGTSETMALQFHHGSDTRDVWYVHYGEINYWKDTNYKIIVKGGGISYIHESSRGVDTEIYYEPSFDITTAQGLAHIKDIFDSYWKELSESILNDTYSEEVA